MKIRIKKDAPCCCGPASDCGGQTQASLETGPNDGPVVIGMTSSVWNLKDHLGRIRCRLGISRMNYTTAPGLYALGSPDAASNVFVTANYKLSFDVLRRALAGLNAWLIVLDTKGINVWCAAGKGTFGTEELVRRIFETRLHGAISHRRLILPQLGAPGIAAHEVRKETGFTVSYGPVYARDIPAYLSAGRKATPEMRKAGFSFKERLPLVPMELIPALKYYLVFAALCIIVFGLNLKGSAVTVSLNAAKPFLVMGAASILAGTIGAPLLLPVLPTRSFALKGWGLGIAAVILSGWFTGLFSMNFALIAASLVFFPAASSYLALLFTGSTSFTGPSGVKKEMRYAIPAYACAAVLSLVMLIVHKLGGIGVL